MHRRSFYGASAFGAPTPMGTLALFYGMPSDLVAEDSWLRRFHTGDRAAIEECYREHASRALAAATRVVSDVDAETVTHEIFFRLLTDDSMRKSFDGRNFGAWVSKIAHNRAIDLFRRRKREVPNHHDGDDERADDTQTRIDDEVAAKLLIERFQKECLPEKFRGVFEARFIRQIPQQKAANELSIARSTLVYQEEQVRSLLHHFLLDES